MKRPIAFLLAFACLVTVVLSGCSGNTSTSGEGSTVNEKKTDAGTTTKEKAEPPVEIKIMMDFTIAQPPSNDNPVLKEFEKRTNSKLNITWVSGPEYLDRLNVVLSSGDLPELIKINDVVNPVFQQMVKQGAFWDLTPFLKENEHLMEYPDIIWKTTAIDGKNFVVPIARPLNGFVYPSIRKDWLDKLGLEVPKTMDELYEVMKAFKEQKPDGKEETYGFTMRAPDFLEDVFTGANRRWKLQDGKLIDVHLEPEMRESLLFRKKLYDEGLIPPDFAVMKDNQFWDLATGGKVGITSETIEATWRWTYDQWNRNNEVDWMPLVSLSAPGRDPFVPQYRGYIGVVAIPKHVPEAKVKKILSVLNFGASEEGGTLSLYGIEGLHYNVVDGFKVSTEQAVKDSVGVGAFGKMFMRYDPYMYAFAPGMPKEKFERNQAVIDERAKIAVPDPAVGLVSQTNLIEGPEYTKKMNDMKTNVIMGKASIEDWDAFVNQLKADPIFQKMITEMNEAYQTREALK
jgi:putative aldouronate transport system substrate-binding protein